MGRPPQEGDQPTGVSRVLGQATWKTPGTAGRRTQALVIPDGVHFVRARRRGAKSRWYLYAWRGGPLIGTCDSVARPRLDHADVARVLDAREPGCDVRPGTLRALIREWHSDSRSRPSSDEWRALPAGIKRSWGAELKLIDAKWGEVDLAMWSRPQMGDEVIAWREERVATAKSADSGVKAIDALLEFGCARGRLTHNPLRDLTAISRASERPQQIWTDEELARFIDVARRRNQMPLADGVRLAALTGLRREHLVSLTWAEASQPSKIKLHRARGKQARSWLAMPRLGRLADLLGELRERHRSPGVDTVLVNGFGQYWSGVSFGKCFSRLRDAAEIFYQDEDGNRYRKHLDDLRATYCLELIANSGSSDREIAKVMGWPTAKVVKLRQLYGAPSLSEASASGLPLRAFAV